MPISNSPFLNANATINTKMTIARSFAISPEFVFSFLYHNSNGNKENNVTQKNNKITNKTDLLSEKIERK